MADEKSLDDGPGASGNGSMSLNEKAVEDAVEVLRDEFFNFRHAEVSLTDLGIPVRRQGNNSNRGKNTKETDIDENSKKEEDSDMKGESEEDQPDGYEVPLATATVPLRTKFEMEHVASSRGLQSGVRFLTSTYLGEMPLSNGGGTWDKTKDEDLFMGGAEDKDSGEGGEPVVQTVPIPVAELEKSEEKESKESKSGSGDKGESSIGTEEAKGERKEMHSSEEKGDHYFHYSQSREYK